jgi:hypothetical protein
MKTKLINDGPQKTYVLVLEKGDETVSCESAWGSGADRLRNCLILLAGEGSRGGAYLQPKRAT